MPPFIVTLGTFGIAQSLATVLTEGNSVTGLSRRMCAGSTTAPSLGIPVPIWATVAVFALTWRAALPHASSAATSSPSAATAARWCCRACAARLPGAVYVYAGVLAALASFIMTARMNAAHPTIGVGLEFDAIAAVILGGTSFEKGRGGIVGHADRRARGRRAAQRAQPDGRLHRVAGRDGRPRDHRARSVSIRCGGSTHERRSRQSLHVAAGRASARIGCSSSPRG